LAKRGIVSSICSKNDEETIARILKERGIFDYFVFPSISWESKGPRLLSLIEAVQLRPASVMFIDDNPNNLAEAKSFLPDIQVEDETFISRILSDSRFVGKDDANLTRLTQYKLLESRKQDQAQAAGGNEEFLRGCDVRVYVEYDVHAHIDRAVELINRTNQLNFTKKRLPEDITEAKKALESQINVRIRQSGLIRVADKYGDYGFVGFFLLENGTADPVSGLLSKTLLHYCFSCRVLGMHVEKWFYDRIQSPKINIVGEVLVDLSIAKNIDWIRMVQSLSDVADPSNKAFPEIRVHGGCEANSIAHYLSAQSEKVSVTGNFGSGAHFVRVNGASLLLSACDRAGPAFMQEAAALRIPYEMLVSRYFQDPPEGTVFVFGGQYDCPGPHRYRHRIHGWEIKIEPQGLGNLDVVKMSDDELARKLDEIKATPSNKDEISAVAWHIHSHYESIPHPNEDELSNSMRALFDRVPTGSKLVIILDDERYRGNEGNLKHAAWVKKYSERIRKFSAAYHFVAIASFTDCIENEDEIFVGGNHYDRKVYFRMAQYISSKILCLPVKQENSIKLLDLLQEEV
jgi:FkbH-like protein